MKVGIVGFGKTGKEVTSVLLESKMTCVEWVLRRTRKLEHRSVPEFFGIESDEPGLIFSIDEMSISELLDRYPVDIIIDFSSEEGLDYYGEEAAQRGLVILSAVSQYSEAKLEIIQKLSEKTKVIYSPNITLGINFLIIASKILKNIAPYADVEIVEEHFKSKPEVSGTAKVIAKGLNVPVEKINTIRAGGIIGVHEILFGFPYQTVRLKHESITREAFGNGVLFAIQNIPSTPAGLYSMEDLMNPFFNVNAVVKESKPWWKVW